MKPKLSIRALGPFGRCWVASIDQHQLLLAPVEALTVAQAIEAVYMPSIYLPLLGQPVPAPQLRVQ